MQSYLQRIVASNWFQNGILLLILLAALLVGLETYPELASRYRGWFDLLNSAILWAFVVEAAMKMAQHGTKFWKYFLDPWNVFDFIIVVVCFLPIDAEYAAVLRLARVVRTLRLVTALPRLQLIVNALIKSIPSMGYIGLLLLLSFYVYGVLGVFLFRENDPVHFRNLEISMLSMFRVATLEDWTDVMYIQMYGSDNYAYENNTGLPTDSTPQPYVGAFFFVSFVMLVTMIMMNLFIGVILNSMDEAQAEKLKKEEMEKELRNQERKSSGSDDDVNQSLGTIDLKLDNGTTVRCELVPLDDKGS